MRNKFIEDITALTRVDPDGQRCIAVLVMYNREIENSSLHSETFEVEGRTVTDVFTCSNSRTLQKADTSKTVAVMLDAGGENGRTYFPGAAYCQKPARVEKATVRIRQVREISATDGLIPASLEFEENLHQINPVVDDFVQGSFKGLSYNLFIPKDYDPRQSYPLVLFIHDSGVCGRDPLCTLTQGVGALVWASENFQKRHPCFVLAPQFDLPQIVDDDGNTDHRIEVAKSLLDLIVSEYAIDPNRLYATGQSMGCMSLMVLNIRYPHLFAATLFVAGQWDERAFEHANLEKKHFWFLNSMGDAKAFPGMNQILAVLEKQGARIARQVWDARWDEKKYEEHTKELVATAPNMIYTPFDITSVANGWSSFGGEHHTCTWRFAYNIPSIREWIFSQRKEEM